MKLNHEESCSYQQLVDEVAHYEICQQMRQYIQHGHITTYDHCLSVSQLCFLVNRRFHLGADEAALVRAAFLHDFYLYDWHCKDSGHKWHGFHHAEKALENANRYFRLSAKEQRMIYCHMWPLNITRVPDSREAAILCACDKFCALKEICFQR